MQSNFPSISLKTKESSTRKVTHLFRVSSALWAIQNALVREQGFGGGLGEVPNARRQNAQVECTGGGDEEGDTNRGRDRRRRVVPVRRLEIHGDDHAQVVVGPDDGVKGRDEN